MNGEEKPRTFCVPEDCLFDTVDKSMAIFPNDAVSFMVSEYDYLLLETKCRELEAKNKDLALARLAAESDQNTLDNANIKLNVEIAELKKVARGLADVCSILTDIKHCKTCIEMSEEALQEYSKRFGEGASES